MKITQKSGNGGVAAHKRKRQSARFVHCGINIPQMAGGARQIREDDFALDKGPSWVAELWPDQEDGLSIQDR